MPDKNMSFPSSSCCPLAQDGCFFTVLAMQLRVVVYKSPEHKELVLSALLFVGQILDVKYPMSFLRARSALQPLPTKEPNAFFFSLVEQKKNVQKKCLTH